MKIKLLNTSTREPVGEIKLENGKTVVDLKDEKVKKEIEELFSKPFEYHASLESADKDITATVKKTAEPNTREFYQKAVYELLKFDLKGVVEDELFNI